MIDKKLLAQVHSIYIKSRRLATEAFTGEFLSAFRGQGMEFSEFREYIPGDDIRLIDWHVTARFDKPYIKIHHEEREQSVMLLVDTSASTLFGSNGQTKKKYITELAALLAYAANSCQDKVGLILFSDHVEHFIPPKKGRSHIWQIIRTILTFKAQNQKTDLSRCLKYLVEVVKKSAVTFIISDFITESNYDDAFKAAHSRHDIIPIVIRDSFELKFPIPYLISFTDYETNERQYIDFSSKKNREHFELYNDRQVKILKNNFDKLGLDSLFIHSGQDYLKPLIKLFRFRERRS